MDYDCIVGQGFKIGTSVTLAMESVTLGISAYNIILYCRLPHKATPTILFLTTALLYSLTVFVADATILFGYFHCAFVDRKAHQLGLMFFVIELLVTDFMMAISVSLALTMYHLIFCIKKALGQQLDTLIQPKNADRVAMAFILINSVT
jgi:hypothetical protein